MTPDEERDRMSRGIPPVWASAWGEDEFGPFACFDVKGVRQRMRWIERGEFLMGSPEREVGRWPDEGPQHVVKLSGGFWLADIPCTQELWVAVMGGNPSEYKSRRRPVERVSLMDVARFLEVLNWAVLGLDARLPTEAQWEYACRAGTREATYAGNLSKEDLDPRLDDIAWYRGSEGDLGTREVGLKRPNDWGLYDMLGNVMEWCLDRKREYGSETVTDPVGTVGPERACRGGSWNSFARFARAANRNWQDPGSHGGRLGFRLARAIGHPGGLVQPKARRGGKQGQGRPARRSPGQLH